MNGEFKIKLPFSQGQLFVTKNDWYIQFYFRGPDSRYNGDFLTISKGKIDVYIKAYKQNWKKYLELKKMIAKLGHKFSTNGVQGMEINIGGYYEGVCINNYNLPLKSEKDIKKIICSFEWAKKKAAEVMKILKKNISKEEEKLHNKN